MKNIFSVCHKINIKIILTYLTYTGYYMYHFVYIIMLNTKNNFVTFCDTSAYSNPHFSEDPGLLHWESDKTGFSPGSNTYHLDDTGQVS